MRAEDRGSLVSAWQVYDQVKAWAIATGQDSHLTVALSWPAGRTKEEAAHLARTAWRVEVRPRKQSTGGSAAA